MNSERYEELILDYLTGNLDEVQQQEFETLVATGAIPAAELEATQAAYQAFHTLPDPEPGPGLDAKFNQLLATEKQKVMPSGPAFSWGDLWQQLNIFLSPAKFAYTLVIFFTGFLVAWLAFSPKQRQQQQDPDVKMLATELSQMKQVLFTTLIDQPLAVDRLQAVNISQEMTNADSRVIDALFNSLNNDPNVNVRLAAVEALKNHTSKPEVRAGLILSISKQDSPMVQIALADLMQALQEKEAVPQLKQLLQDESTNELVKDKIKESINVLI
ncbi:HEAT repeat domain-containing protein [Pontibacter sp. BT731]|uniref:HEAT repeat domain-containing protein n=1 Tax=Pontibacter coccineus TaxID=3063328 RepID=UPI0026E26B86|nr:HEAT repeat domain-containing protein [Pontibacter sp. BT731]MDO6388754.1 HEAT repeat domain-containing protein [Pontibacter sp. BT731]